jgi:hypothetical protein
MPDDRTTSMIRAIIRGLRFTISLLEKVLKGEPI